MHMKGGAKHEGQPCKFVTYSTNKDEYTIYEHFYASVKLHGLFIYFLWQRFCTLLPNGIHTM